MKKFIKDIVLVYCVIIFFAIPSLMVVTPMICAVYYNYNWLFLWIIMIPLGCTLFKWADDAIYKVDELFDKYFDK